MFDSQHDIRVRMAAFQWLSSMTAVYGDVLPRRLLAEGFVFEGSRVPLVGPAGIFKPRVPNGLSLCALHHAAFDRSFVGLRPDYTIEVRPDILHEHDGPTLVHAIQALHGARIAVPSLARLRPDPELFEIRYQRFRDASTA